MVNYTLYADTLGNENFRSYGTSPNLNYSIEPLIQNSAKTAGSPTETITATILNFICYRASGATYSASLRNIPTSRFGSGNAYLVGAATDLSRVRNVFPAVIAARQTYNNMKEASWSTGVGGDVCKVVFNRAYYIREDSGTRYLEFWQDKLDALFTESNVTATADFTAQTIQVSFPSRGLDAVDCVCLYSAELDGTELVSTPKYINQNDVSVTIDNPSDLSGSLELTFKHIPTPESLDKVVITKTIAAKPVAPAPDPVVPAPSDPVPVNTTLVPSLTDLQYVSADTKFQIKCILSGDYGGKTFEKLELTYALTSSQSDTTTLEYLTKASDDWYDISIADNTTIIMTPKLSLSDDYEITGTSAIIARTGTTATFVTTDNVLDILAKVSVILSELDSTKCQIVLQHPFLFKNNVKKGQLYFTGNGETHTFSKNNPANSSTLRIDCTGLTADTEYNVAVGFEVGGVVVYGQSVKMQTAIELDSSPTSAQRRTYNIDRSLKLMFEPKLLSTIADYTESDKQDIIKQSLSQYSAGTTLPINKDRNPLNQSWENSRASTETNFSKKASQIEDSLLGFITANIPDIDENLDSY